MSNNKWSVAFGRRELVNKLSLTLLVLLIYKVGIYISVPGIDKEILKMFVGNTDALEIANLISGGAMSQFSIFALGVMPYITASIIVQLLAFDIVPVLAEWKQQGEYGNKKMKKLTYKIAVAFALLQGVALSYSLNMLFPGLLINDSVWYLILVAAILTLGTIVLILLSELVNKKGIGNGMSIIIFGSIMMSMPAVFTMYYETYLVNAGDMLAMEIIKAVLLLAAVILILAFVVFVSKSERRIPISSSVNTGRQAFGDMDEKYKNSRNDNLQNFLPFKLLGVGVVPVIFAVSIILAPTTIAQYNPNASWSAWVIKYISMETWTGAILYMAVIIFFSYFYTFMQFNPQKLADDLKKGKNFIPLIRPGEETEKYLKGVLQRVTFTGSLVLALIAIIPIIAGAVIQLPTSVQLGGVSMIIIVSVALDVVSRVSVYRNLVTYDNGVFSKRGG